MEVFGHNEGEVALFGEEIMNLRTSASIIDRKVFNAEDRTLHVKEQVKFNLIPEISYAEKINLTILVPNKGCITFSI